MGWLGIPVGSKVRAAFSAAWTSRAAPSMLRLRSNCKVIRVLPRELLEVISVTPAIRPRERSRGVATVVAMVSGLAPGSEACTEMVGKSTCGRGETGNWVNASTPDRAMPRVRSVVATGRLMKVAETFIRRRELLRVLPNSPASPCGHTLCKAVQGKINHRGRKQGHDLAEDQAADHDNAERMADFGADARSAQQSGGA